MTAPTHHTTPVTDRNSAVCNADLVAVPVERVTSGSGSKTLQSALGPAITDRSRLWVWVQETFTLPDLLTEREPGVDQIRRYARYARYAPRTGVRRNAGIAWCYLVAIPALVASRLWAWVWQRPSRALVVAVTVKALTALPPVGWTVDHLITPTVNAALRLFL